MPLWFKEEIQVLLWISSRATQHYVNLCLSLCVVVFRKREMEGSGFLLLGEFTQGDEGIWMENPPSFPSLVKILLALQSEGFFCFYFLPIRLPYNFNSSAILSYASYQFSN